MDCVSPSLVGETFGVGAIEAVGAGEDISDALLLVAAVSEVTVFEDVWLLGDVVLEGL